MSCEATESEGGVFVKTFSGREIERNPICAIGKCNDIKHFIVFENLLPYPVDISFTCEILNTPNVLKFACSLSLDTANCKGLDCIEELRWSGNINELEQNGTCAFDYVTLLPGAIKTSNPERIKLSIQLCRISRGGGIYASKPLSISVRQ